MASLAEIIPAVVGGGALTWAGNLVLQLAKGRDDRLTKAAEAGATLEQHTDKFALDLLAAARTEMSIVKAEVDSLRPLQTRMAHLDEALDHIEALLKSEGADERAAAERRAKAFLNRMRRLADARGTIANEVQIAQSSASLPPEIKDVLRKLD